MPKSPLVFSCLVVAFLFISCSATMPGAGGVFPGALVNSTVTPGALANCDQRYAAYPDSFRVLGVVEGSSTNVNVLGLFSFGNGGYINALEDARLNSGGDGLINCSADIHSFSIFGLFSKSTTRVKGIAVELR